MNLSFPVIFFPVAVISWLDLDLAEYDNWTSDYWQDVPMRSMSPFSEHSYKHWNRRDREVVRWLHVQTASMHHEQNPRLGTITK